MPYIDLGDEEEQLIEAAKCGDVGEVVRLLKAGVDVHTAIDAPIRVAAQRGQTEVARILLNAGANVSAYEDEPLYWAAGNGYLETTRVLLEYGAQINRFIVRRALKNGHMGVVDLLETWLLDGGMDWEYEELT